MGGVTDPSQKPPVWEVEPPVYDNCFEDEFSDKISLDECDLASLEAVESMMGEEECGSSRSCDMTDSVRRGNSIRGNKQG